MSREELTPDEIAALFAVDCDDESDDNDEDDGDNLDKLMECLANDYDKDEEYKNGVLNKREMDALLEAINGNVEDNQEKLNLFSNKDEIIKQLCKLSLYDITIDEVPLVIDGTKKTYYNLRAVVPANKVLSQGEIDIIVKSLKRGYRI